MTDRDAAKLIEEFRPPRHVVRHCAAVADFAIELGKRLILKGEKVNLSLLRHAALLHDLLRICDFRNFSPENFPDPASKEDIKFWKTQREKFSGMGHEEACARILEERGFKDVARLVRKHRYVQILEGLDSWEEKLLYYADKRTKHDKIVPLKERLLDGRRRNAPETIGDPDSKKIDEKIFELEREIFTKFEEEPTDS